MEENEENGDASSKPFLVFLLRNKSPGGSPCGVAGTPAPPRCWTTRRLVHPTPELLTAHHPILPAHGCFLGVFPQQKLTPQLLATLRLRRQLLVPRVRR